MLSVLAPSIALLLGAPSYYCLRRRSIQRSTWQSDMMPRRIARRLRSYLRLHGITSFVLDIHVTHGKKAGDGQFTLHIPSEQFPVGIGGSIKIVCRDEAYIAGPSFFKDLSAEGPRASNRVFTTLLFVTPKSSQRIVQLGEEHGISVIAPQDLKEFVASLRQLKAGKVINGGRVTGAAVEGNMALEQVRGSSRHGAGTVIARESKPTQDLPEEHVPDSADLPPNVVGILGRTRLLLAIEFTRNGNAEEFCIAGWSGQERNYRWTDGFGATLWCPDLAPTGDDYMLSIRATVCKPSAQPYQRLIVHVNGRLTAGIVCTSSRIDSDLFVPAMYCHGCSGLRIEFTVPDAIRPSEIIESNDRRLIALAFEKVQIYALCPRDEQNAPRSTNHLSISAREQ